MAISTELSELLEFRPQHLAWPCPPDIVKRVGEESALFWLRNRKAEIIRSEADPLRNGYEPHIWEKVIWHIRDLRKKFPVGVIKIILWGGNRSSKTRFAANFLNRFLVENPKSHWWCCDSTEAQARANQMRLIYEQFPPEWMNLPRAKMTDVAYTSDGFPKNRFVAPNGSEVDFKFYSMKIESLVGPELDGIWADELIPLEWVDVCRFRLTNRNGILLITFTPEFGWNDTIGYFYEGAQILEEREAPLCPRYDEEGRLIGYKKVPRVMQCRDEKARIIYFHTDDNPFGNYEGMIEETKDKGEEGKDGILIRVYGYCTQSHATIFTKFSRKMHVISQVTFSQIAGGNVTEKKKIAMERYHLVDPCSGRNWFMIWVLCPYPDKWIVYREWPSYGHPGAYIQNVGMPGPWALTGAALDGVAGPGQSPSFCFGLQRYEEEIKRQENGEIVLARYIDSRYASAATLDRERTTTLIEQMAEVGMDFLGMTAESKILDVKDGSIDMINSALYYDVERPLGEYSPSLGRLNEPQLQILETCPNTIYALEHWTGQDGQRGACKDPIDCLRGLFLSGVNYVGKDQYIFIGGGIPR